MNHIKSCQLHIYTCISTPFIQQMVVTLKCTAISQAHVSGSICGPCIYIYANPKEERLQQPSGLIYFGGRDGHLSFMCEYGSTVLYSGNSILYFPLIWQNGSLTSSSLLHHSGRRLELSSKNLRAYASFIVNSVTCMELPIGSKSPDSLYISRMKATQEVDFPSE